MYIKVQLRRSSAVSVSKNAHTKTSRVVGTGTPACSIKCVTGIMISTVDTLRQIVAQCSGIFSNLVLRF